MYLTIDLGNTRQKAAVYTPEGKLAHLIDEKQLTQDCLKNLMQTFHIEAAIVSSVADTKFSNRLSDWLHQQTKVVEFTHQTKLPIRIAYETPDTLGLDRLAAAVAAHCKYPDANVLIIQAGTCLVTDFVTSDGVYLGGSISPGLQMRFDALQHFTKRLPSVKIESITEFVGSSTEKSILSGVMFGITDEINGTIERYQQRFGDIKVILTGGNKNDLEFSIKNAIFAANYLVLEGLYNILRINA